jgi:hypothetical protein
LEQTERPGHLVARDVTALQAGLEKLMDWYRLPKDGA